MNNIKRKKGGFSMVEVVIAMTVVVIVSIAALMFIDFSIKNAVEISNKTQAKNFAENTLACFKASDDYEDFKAKIKFFLGEEGDNLIESRPEGRFVYSYTSDIYNFTSKIQVEFCDDEDAEKTDTFEITVTRKGEEIVHFEFTKYPTENR